MMPKCRVCKSREAETRSRLCKRCYEWSQAVKKWQRERYMEDVPRCPWCGRNMEPSAVDEDEFLIVCPKCKRAVEGEREVIDDWDDGWLHDKTVYTTRRFMPEAGPAKPLWNPEKERWECPECGHKLKASDDWCSNCFVIIEGGKE